MYSKGKTCVTFPRPLVLPSLKSTLAPTLTNSGFLMNLNMTLAWSLLLIPFSGKMPSMTAVCLMLPMWTVVLNPGTISVGWKRTQTLAWRGF